MSMSTQEVEEYLNKKKESAEVKEPSTETKAPEEVTPAPSEENSAPEEENKDGVPAPETKPEEVKGSDEPEKSAEPEKKEPEDKASKPEKKDEGFDPVKELGKRDYAFIREKNKRKEQMARYEAKIKELEDELSKYKDLKPEHFKKNDGTQDTQAYVDYRLKQRDMENEIHNLQEMDAKEQQQYDLEEDRRRVNNCFPDDKEREEYQSLIAKNGTAFYQAVSEVDKDGVVFNYLSSLPEYPVVLRELMTDSRLLGRVFRSTDPQVLKQNIMAEADRILDKRHEVKTAPAEQPTIVQTQQTTAAPAKEEKKIPIIGKQITNSSAPTPEEGLHGRASWNSWLLKHPRSH